MSLIDDTAWKNKYCIKGVGKDVEMVVNEYGGKQSKIPYNFMGIDAHALFAMAKVLQEGKEKYGADENWRKIPVAEHLNHAMTHIMAYKAGDKSDGHLSHLLCRAMFACAVEIENLIKEGTYDGEV